MIETNKLTKYYKHHARGILDVSLKVEEGEIFGFIGPNGAGKSTTVRTLLNLIFPSSGTAEVMGLDIIKDSVEIRKNVGYIPSEVNYYGNMTVRKFLNYSTSFHQDDYQDRIEYLSERLELDLNRKIESLSFGNKKKVAIVAAFAYQPKILILDEPTSGLDPLMQSVFFELLEEERSRGATVFFSSHVLSDVQRICDRVGIVKDGRLIKIESLEEIMKTRAKNIRIVSNDIILKEDKNIFNLKQNGEIYTFTYAGKIAGLLKKLESATIKDISITEPTLEEIFLHYYSRGDDADEAID